MDFFFFFLLKENENTVYQDLWMQLKQCRKKIVVLDAHIRKKETSQNSDLSIYFKKLEKGEQIKFKIS